MPHKPSYIRLHRGECGVFKNVIFLKYPNLEIAEECKLRLERLYIVSRQLRVEFKKKEKTTVEREESVMLQQIVRDLRVSAEHEGFKYRRCELSKKDMKLLRQLCHSYGLVFEPGEKVVTVHRVLSASGRPSPALPQLPSQLRTRFGRWNFAAYATGASYGASEHHLVLCDLKSQEMCLLLHRVGGALFESAA
ncbi:hypothetical protein TRVL_06955 [Trypanosoma vivax]|nr:hypothetical protein TRVL_06955 [Trypanosoma vivax]